MNTETLRPARGWWFYLRLPAAVVVGLAALAAFTSPDLALALVSWWSLYRYLDPTLSWGVFDTRAWRLTVSVCLYLALLQATALLGFVVDAAFPLGRIIPLGAAVVAAMWSWRLVVRRVVARRGQSGLTPSPGDGRPGALTTSAKRRYDVVSWGTALVLVAAMAAGPVLLSLTTFGGLDVGYLTIASMSSGLDDGSHLHMLNDRLRNDLVLIPGASYPTSWHAANGALIRAIVPKIQVGGASATAYVLAKMLWTLVLVYLFVRTALAISQHLVGPATAAPRLLVGGTGCYFAYLVLMGNYKDGFFSYLPLLIGVLLTLALLLQADEATEGPASIRPRALAPLLLAMGLVGLSWDLVLPAVALAALVTGLRPDGLTWRSRLGGLATEAVWQAPLLMVVALAVLTQAQVTASGVSLVTALTAPGGIAILPGTLFLVVSGGVVATFWLAPRSARLVNATVLMACLMLLAAAVYAVQMLAVQHPDYYYYKVLMAVLVVAIPVAIGGAVLSGERMLAGRPRWLRYPAQALVLLWLPLGVGVDPTNVSMVAYLTNHASMGPHWGRAIYADLEARADQPAADFADAIVYRPGDPAGSIIGTNILRGIYDLDACDRRQFDSLNAGDEAALLAAIEQCQVAPLTIYTSQSLAAQVEATTRGLRRRVDVVAVAQP